MSQPNGCSQHTWGAPEGAFFDPPLPDLDTLSAKEFKSERTYTEHCYRTCSTCRTRALFSRQIMYKSMYKFALSGWTPAAVQHNDDN